MCWVGLGWTVTHVTLLYCQYLLTNKKHILRHVASSQQNYIVSVMLRQSVSVSGGSDGQKLKAWNATCCNLLTTPPRHVVAHVSEVFCSGHTWVVWQLPSVLHCPQTMPRCNGRDGIHLFIVYSYMMLYDVICNWLQLYEFYVLTSFPTCDILRLRLTTSSLRPRLCRSRLLVQPQACWRCSQPAWYAAW